MNGIRPREILEVLRALEDPALTSATSRPVLATVVSLDGSVYSRAGAMAVFASARTERPGVIPPEELGGQLPRLIEETARAGKPRLASLTVPEDDPILGFGLAAPGKVEILLEPANERLREHMRRVREELVKGAGVVCSVEVEGPRVGRRSLLRPEDPAAKECYLENSPELVESAGHGQVRRTFLAPIHPMGKVLVFGSASDALRLAWHLSDLYFTVTVADPRPGRLRGLAWDRRVRAATIEGGWEQARQAVMPDEDTSIVVITHSYALDLETLQGALKSPAAYVGVTGPQKRTQRLLKDLEALEVRPREGAFFAPAGLDIGAATPEETALGVAAEILAARSGRKGGRLSPRRPHQAPSHIAAKIPGLVLAAGRGRRFAGGHKLSAAVDGRPVLRHVVENALASKLDPVIVVLGCDAEAGLAALHGLEDPRLRVVFNPLWEGGKASSIEVGLREVPFPATGVVSLLGDMPMVKPWLIDRVIAEFELSGKLTFPVFPRPEGPRKGYPTAFPRALFGEIRALTGDDTAMDAVRTHWSEALKIPLADALTQADIDTAEDLQLLLSGASGESLPLPLSQT